MKPETKINITHIIDGLGIGGAERIVYELATGLDPERYTVEVLHLTPPRRMKLSQALAMAEQLQQAGITVTHIPKRTKLGRQLLRDLTAHLRATKPDIVHTHLFASDVWGTVAAHRAGVSTIISTEHNINRDEGRIKHILKCATMRYRSTVVAISESVAHYIKRYCRTAGDKIQVIPNGVAIDRFQNVAATRPKNSIAIIAVIARLEQQKGHSDLLQTLSHLTVPYRLLIVGDGSLRQTLEQQVQQLELSEHVRFLGTQSDLTAIYQQADIVAIPSRWEGFGLVAVEAMAAGCTVVAAPVGGLTEIVRDNENGLLIDFRFPVPAALSVTELLQNQTMRQRLSQQGRKTAEHYDVLLMIQAYQEVYRNGSEPIYTVF